MAYVDRRELILTEILTILGTIPDVVGTYRDRADFQPVDPDTGLDQLPAIVLLDGDEQTVAAGKGDPLNQQMGPSVVKLMPQIFVILKPTDDVRNIGQAEALSKFRRLVFKAITTDVNLWALLGGNGNIEYLGCLTDMKTGSSVSGQMQIEFAFYYRVDPRELTAS